MFSEINEDRIQGTSGLCNNSMLIPTVPERTNLTSK